MGISSCLLEPRQPLAPLDSPPELESPGVYVLPPRQFEDRPWNSVVPVSPPMSNYDPTTKTEGSSAAGKSPTDDTAAAASQAAPRQQLPSLSSIFGPPQARPLHSPLSDRPGSYSLSPLDRSHGPTPTLERPYNSSSYFPSSAAPPSLSQPRSTHDPRLNEDRTPFPPLSRPFPGPLSPRARDPEYQRPPSSSEFSNGSRLSNYQDSSRNEYSFGGRESGPYKPQHERLQQLPSQGRGEDSAAAYRDQRTTPQSTSQNPPSTPASTVVSEGIPAKDGLGPKIWTGTHFLPRFVRAAEVPGEGTCYFYDDGSHCKTVIDGEAVNAHWGVTKAGKPRKRLAIACVTCREKKIKCDPDYPRCVQCEKFGRVCKFKNAPRGGHNTSPSTPPAEPDESRRLGPMIRPPPEHQRPSSNSSDSVSPRTILRPGSPDRSGGMPHKRIRLGYERFTPTMGPRSPIGTSSPLDPSRQQHHHQQHHHYPNAGPSWHHHVRQPVELPRIHEDVLCRAWQTDPYVSDPQSVTSTITSFFVHADAAGLRFLPEKAFTNWVQTAHRKTPEDLMLVYSILALGVALSGGPKNIAHEYSQVARYATEHAGAPSPQLVHSRIALSLFYLAVSRPGDANDMSSAAISSAACLQMNLELDQSQDAAMVAFPYNLTRAGYAECRRRTFWSCLILERLNGMFPARVAIINTEDIFIRLPADVKSFEDQVEVMTPEFEPHFSSTHQHYQSSAGVMAYLVQVVALWGDVMTSIHRAALRGPTSSSRRGSSADASRTHDNMITRLEDWRLTLPHTLTYSTSNLDRISPQDKGSYVLMHLIYHLTIIKLHRHVHPTSSSPSASNRSAPNRHQRARTAKEHAQRLVEIACAVAKDGSLGRSTMPPPFSSYAILEAADVLSAEGSLAELPALVDGLALARSIIEILSTAWEDAKAHRVALDHRLDVLAALRDRGSPADGAAPAIIPGVRVFRRDEQADKALPATTFWQTSEALEARFPKEMDCVYGSITPF